MPKDGRPCSGRRGGEEALPPERRRNAASWLEDCLEEDCLEEACLEEVWLEEGLEEGLEEEEEEAFGGAGGRAAARRAFSSVGA